MSNITFQIQPNKAFKAGQWVLAQSASTPSAQLYGQIVSYSGTALVVNMIAQGGAGTFSDWQIVLANSPAAAGYQPPIGTGNVTGPGSAGSGNLATFADTTGKVLSDSGLLPGALASRTTLLYGDAGAASIGDAALISGAAPLCYVAPQPNDNLHLLNDATNPTRDINVTSGRCRDDSDVINLQLAATMVKRLDTSWAAGGVAGSPAGACDSGAKGASQTWHTYLIARRGLAVTSVSRASNVATITSASHGLGVGCSVRNYGIGSGFDGLAAVTAVTANTFSYANTGANVAVTAVAAFADGFDILASQAYPAPAMPAGWTARQCLGSFLTDSSGNIISVTQVGNEFLLNFFPAISGVSPLSNLGTLVSFPVPLGVRVLVKLHMQGFWTGNNASTILVSSPDQPDEDPGTVGGQLTGHSTAGTFTNAQGVELTIRSNTSAQIRMREDPAGNSVSSATCQGWLDPRRRLF